MKYRQDIQILRGVAVVLVVLFHLDFQFLDHGFLGVDAFFVISGFLMAILYKVGDVQVFYRRRASRLLPAYFATIIVTLAVSAFVTLPLEHAQVVEQALFASTFASNIGFWMQNSYFSKAEFNPLLHLWSLGVEIQFYLFVPFIVWLYRRSRIMVAMIALGSIAAAFFLVTISPKTAFFMMPFRIWQFLAGAGIAWYFTNSGTIRFPKPWLGAFALISLLIVAIAYPVDGQLTQVVYGHPGLAALLITLSTAGVLAFGLPSALEQSILGNIFAKLGDWSYSIYLAHFPIIVLGLYLPFSGTILTPTGLPQTILLGLGIAAFSTVLYQIFEKRRIWSGSLKVVGVVMCSVALFATVTTTVSRAQYNTEQLNILAAFGDRSPYRCGKLIRVLNPTALLCELTGLPESMPALVLVGDSHADSVKTAFAQIAKERGFRLFFVVSNSPVVAAPNTAQLLEKFEVHGIEGVIAHFSSNNALRAYDLEFASQTRSAGFEVVWLLDVPTFTQNVPSMIWSLPSQSKAKAANLIEISELEVLLHLADITLFDPRDVFCPDECLLMDGQKHPFYFDRGHLTLTGAQQLEDMLRSVIDQFDRGR